MTAILGLTDQTRDEFCKLIAQGFLPETAGTQVGLGPEEAALCFRRYRRRIQQFERKSTRKPPSDPATVKPRPCLMCGETFVSTHAGNRTCPDCKGTQYYRDAAREPARF